MKIHRLTSHQTFVSAAAVLWLALVIYFVGPRQNLSTANASQIEFFLLAVLLLGLFGAVLVLLFQLLRRMFSKNRLSQGNALRGTMLFLITFLLLIATIVIASQWFAHTPPILGADGKPLPGSIAVMEKVRLGGVEQWLIIRGEDVNKPVLLFVSGGPGGSESARVTRFNQELEKHFVVVLWEQRGCGKSYPSLNPKSALTVEQYANDIIELTDMLRARFSEEKVYLVGHSWGSIIGVRAAQARPDLFYAYIGTSQMVDVRKTDQLIYQAVLDYSHKMGDMGFVKTLQAQGEPPYFGKSPIQPYATLFGREYAIFEGPTNKSPEFAQDGDILLLMAKQPEYGWIDRLNYLLGLMNTFNAVYPQLQEMDFRRDALHFEIPVYLILGRNDMNNPYQIPEEYFHLLEAPSKLLTFFEDSGHGMIWQEAEKFHDIMIHTVLPDTYPTP